MFYDADINKDGVLTFDELYNLFSKINPDMTRNDLMTLMKEIDENNDGKLDIDEFIALMQMDPETMRSESSSKTMLKLKKVKKLDPSIFLK
jgi:Ca2+-binding EF-hand superfamily protein